MRKATIQIAFCALALLSTWVGHAAPAIPQPPMTIWGQFTIDASPASDGVALRALSGDFEYAATMIFSEEDRSGLFVIDIPGDDPNTPNVVEGAQSGEIITFASDGVMIEQSAVWEMGGVINLALWGRSASGPVANFVCTPRVGPAPLTIHCSDNSSGSPTSWQWTFGDGAGSTTQNPTYRYDSSGSYDIALTASNADNSDRLIRLHYILVYSPTPTGTPTGTPISTLTGDFQLTVTPTPAATITPSTTVQAPLTGTATVTNTSTPTALDTPTSSPTPATFSSNQIYLPVVTQNTLSR